MYNWNINKHVKEDRCREIMKNHGWRKKVMKLSFTESSNVRRRQPILKKKQKKTKQNTFTSLILVGCEKADKSLIEAITEP